MLKGHQSYNIPKSNKKVLRIISVFFAFIEKLSLKIARYAKN